MGHRPGGQEGPLGTEPGHEGGHRELPGVLPGHTPRGLADPLLVVTDGAPGLIRAVEECFPRSYRQRCLAHRMRNLEAKVPEHLWPEVRARAKAAYEAPSPEMANTLRDDFVAQYTLELPEAVRCFGEDFA